VGRKPKVVPEIKVRVVEDYINGKASILEISEKLSVNKSTVRSWVRNYKSEGLSGLIHKSSNNSYTSEFKSRAAKEYVEGKGTLASISQKYHIKSRETLRKWILKYNSHEELKTSNAGGLSIMTKGRKTTFQERVAIVKYCIEHNHNYNQTVEKFQVSYQQARNYTVKYETNGVDGLRDGRGKRKIKENMTEVEILRAENKLLKAKNKQAEMELSFLKKLEEIERRRG